MDQQPQRHPFTPPTHTHALENPPDRRRPARISYPKHAAILPCINCRYDLAGLGPAGNCPECGIPIADTHAPDTIAEAPPHHQAELRRGSKIAAVGAAVLLAASILYLVHFIHLLDWPHTTPPPWLWLATTTTVIIGSIISVTGWYSLTQPNPRRHRLSRRSPLRIATRIATPAALVTTATLSTLATLVWLIGHTDSSATTNPEMAFLLAMFISNLVLTAAFIPSQLHLAALATRLHAPRRSTRALLYAIAVPIILMVLTCTGGISFLIAPTLLALLTLETTLNTSIALTKIQRPSEP